MFMKLTDTFLAWLKDKPFSFSRNSIKYWKKIVKTATLKAQKEISGTKVKVNISNVQLDILIDIGLVNERTYIMFLF